MKKGARAICCDMCGNKIGWVIPTGQYDHGIKRVRIELSENGNEFFIGFCQHYRCNKCMEVRA